MKKGVCRYFTGFQNEKCEAGIEYRQLVGGPDFGWAARLPCIKNSPLRKEPRAKCDLYVEPSEEEIARWVQESDARFSAITTARRAIIATQKKQGEIECALCSSMLIFSIASNGHVWGICSTKGCLSWME